MNLDLGSNLQGDSAYTDYEKEEFLKNKGIEAIVERKSNKPLFCDDWQNLKRSRK